jgi:hypothetical protein
MEQWRAAAGALEEQHCAELRGLTPEKALAAIEAVLSMAKPRPISTQRWTHSGLVEQQALFHRRGR